MQDLGYGLPRMHHWEMRRPPLECRMLSQGAGRETLASGRPAGGERMAPPPHLTILASGDEFPMNRSAQMASFSEIHREFIAVWFDGEAAGTFGDGAHKLSSACATPRELHILGTWVNRG
jgi:hypothetical protein